MHADQLVDLLDRIETVTPTVWLAGGWGVDALAGQETRPHGDADLCVDAPSLPAILDLLGAAGFTTREDWLPVRIEVEHPDGRRVDLHPLTFGTDGSATQPGLVGTEFFYPAGCTTAGHVAGRPVTCLTAAQQLTFRAGFTWRPVDHHDVALLRELT